MTSLKFSPRLFCCAIILIFLLSVPSLKAEPRWRDTKTVDIFKIRSEFSLIFHHKALSNLKTLRGDLQKMLGLEIGKNAVEVYLFSSQKSYRAFVGLRNPGAVNRRALYVKGPAGARVYAFRHNRMSTDLRHECTHALLHNSLPYIPIWLDEGLAEYFEVPAKSRYTGHPHVKSSLLRIQKGWKPNLKQLEAVDQFEQMQAEEYRRAWAWVHYMLHHSKESKSFLTTHLQEIKDLKLPEPISTRMGEALPAFNQSLRQHLINLRKNSSR